MKKPEYNEIDGLLRAWAGHVRSDPNGLAGNDAEAHLDADEINSYAEGALPPLTRSRYSSHLVSCDLCRKLVTQLALAAGPVLKESTPTEKSESSGWRRMLGAFLAPSVLRYALPALVVVLVGIVFVSTRLQSEHRSAAETAQSDSRPAGQSTNQQYDDKQGVVATLPDKQAKATPAQTSRAAGTSDKAGEQDQKAADAPATSPTLAKKEPEASKSDTAAAPAEKKEASAKNEAEKAAQGAYASEPPPPAKPASAVQPKDATAVGGLADRQDAAARKRENENSRGSGAATGNVQSSAGRDKDRPKTKALDGLSVDARDEESETRSVAGRRFQRRNGTWVDSAFKSSMAVTRVSRGSEQYRALIADEPEIGAIAKQLSGEVMIVWKGRAYHIR